MHYFLSKVLNALGIIFLVLITFVGIAGIYMGMSFLFEEFRQAVAIIFASTMTHPLTATPDVFGPLQSGIIAFVLIVVGAIFVGMGIYPLADIILTKINRRRVADPERDARLHLLNEGLRMSRMHAAFKIYPETYHKIARAQAEFRKDESSDK